MASDLGEKILRTAFASLGLVSLIGFSSFLIYSCNVLNNLEDSPKKVSRNEKIIKTEYSDYKIDSVYPAFMDFFREYDSTFKNKFEYSQGRNE